MLTPTKRAARRVLLDAANEIELRGLATGTAGTAKGPKCVLGAMTWAATKGREVRTQPSYGLANVKATRAFNLAVVALNGVINGAIPSFRDSTSRIYLWSDRNVQQPVIDGLRKAAERIK